MWGTGCHAAAGETAGELCLPRRETGVFFQLPGQVSKELPSQLRAQAYTIELQKDKNVVLIPADNFSPKGKMLALS